MHIFNLASIEKNTIKNGIFGEYPIKEGLNLTILIDFIKDGHQYRASIKNARYKQILLCISEQNGLSIKIYDSAGQYSLLERREIIFICALDETTLSKNGDAMDIPVNHEMDSLYWSPYENGINTMNGLTFDIGVPYNDFDDFDEGGFDSAVFDAY